MKKIALIAMAVAFPGEKGYPKPAFLADFLVKNGYDVTMITSTFHHWTKAQRNIESLNLESLGYKVRFAYQPAYKKNIDTKRVFSGRVLAHNVVSVLKSGEDYFDAIYLIVPPNDVGAAVCQYAQESEIPVIVDVTDLWPEAMRMVIDIPVISDLLFYPFKRDAEKVYGLASGVIGTSDEYRDRPFKYQQRSIPRETVYVGNDIAEFDAGVAEFSPQIDKPLGEFWVTYAGTLGKSYDISTMIDASAELAKRGRNNVRFKILGGGPTEAELKIQAEALDCNVDFVGYAPYKKMAAYLEKSDVLVNSFVKKAPQSIVTKIGDYLAAAHPMINTCMSSEFRAKVEADGFGVNVVAEDKMLLADAIDKMYQSPNECSEMGRNARRIAKMQFDRPKSYLSIVKMIRELLHEAV